MKKIEFKRICAYIIDIIFIGIIILIMTAFIPINDNEIFINEKISIISENFRNGYIEAEEYIVKTMDYNYEILKENVIEQVLIIISYILYFVILPYVNKGQTVGKKLLKIKVKNAKGKTLSLNNLLIRSFILYGILVSIISLILIMFLPKSIYLMITTILEVFQSVVFIISVVMLFTNKKKRCLHDYAGQTEIIEE